MKKSFNYSENIYIDLADEQERWRRGVKIYHYKYKKTAMTQMQKIARPLQNHHY